MAASIKVFGDKPLGWRYPSVVFGALAIVAMYLCGLALFGSQGAALATAALDLPQPDGVRAVAHRDARHLCADVRSVRHCRLHPRLRQAEARGRVRPCRSRLWPWPARASGAASFRSASPLPSSPWSVCCRDGARNLPNRTPRTGIGPIAGRISAPITSRFASSLVPAFAYFVAWIPVTGFSLSGFIEAQRRIFAENSASHPAHLYMSSWPSWPLLMRPIWYQFDKMADGRFQAIVFLGNPLILWPALAALAICARDFIVARRTQAFLILAFYVGPWLAWATLPRSIGFIYYYLPSATVASLALVYVLTQGERAPPRWALWAFVAASAAGFVALLPISVVVAGNVDGDLSAPDDLQELDLSMIRTRRAALAQSGYRFSLRQNAKRLRGDHAQTKTNSEPVEPGDAPPAKMVAVIVRPVDRERLPIGVAAIVLAAHSGAVCASWFRSPRERAPSAVFGTIEGRGTLAGASFGLAAGEVALAGSSRRGCILGATPRTGAKASRAAKAIPSERVFMAVIPFPGGSARRRRRADRDVAVISRRSC